MRGDDVERRQGVLGLRMRIVRLGFGDEPIAPTEYLTRLRAGRTTFVSPGLVPIADGALGFRAGTMVRDPDGHAIRVLAH